MHHNLEIGIVLTGRIRNFHENWRFDLDAGGIWFAGMYEPHGWRIMADDTRLLLMGFLPDMLMPCRFPEAPGVNLLAPFTVRPSARPRTTPETRNGIMAIANDLCAAVRAKPQERRHGKTGPFLEFAGNAAHDWLWLRAKLLELLAVIHRNWQPPADAADPPLSAIGCVNRALSKLFVEQRHITEEEAAGHCRVSVRTLGSMFRSVLGVSFAIFSMRHRLESAARELVRTRCPVKAIALRWGFTDSSHLNHAFRRRYDCTPSVYRNRHRPAGGPAPRS